MNIGNLIGFTFILYLAISVAVDHLMVHARFARVRQRIYETNETTEIGNSHIK